MHALILALHEDEINSAQVVQSLKLSGHTVLLSRNFAHALGILTSGHVDLIVSDVHLENGGTVFDFLRSVRKNPKTKDIPFVLFSSAPTNQAKYLEEGLRVSARMLGASLYITMEIFDPVEFCKQINSLLPDSIQPCEQITSKQGE